MCNASLSSLWNRPQVYKEIVNWVWCGRTWLVCTAEPHWTPLGWIECWLSKIPSPNISELTNADPYRCSPTFRGKIFKKSRSCYSLKILTSTPVPPGRLIREAERSNLWMNHSFESDVFNEPVSLVHKSMNDLFTNWNLSSPQVQLTKWFSQSR